MPTVSSYLELYTNVNAKLEKAINETARILLKELQDIIIRDVYSRPSPTGENWNGRTQQFLESWNKSESALVGNMVQSVISQDGFNFTWNNERDKWSHGNGWGAIDTALLDGIINDGLDESNFNFPAIEARPYWDNFKQYVAENVDKIFMEQCIKFKLPVVKAGYKFI